MTQNMEQNVRTRDEQLESRYPRNAVYSTLSFGLFKRELIEAEQRGAAEQRRKDVEGSRSVHQWRLTADDEWVNAVDLVELEQVRNGYPNSETRTLYTHPANVAALEARIAELEAAIQDYFDARVGCEIECVSRTGEPERRAKEAARAVLRAALRASLTREGGV